MGLQFVFLFDYISVIYCCKHHFLGPAGWVVTGELRITALNVCS